MNKRLFLIYASVFVLIGLMLHLYRSSYKDMKVFIQEVNRMSQVVVKLQRLDALLHFWLNNDRSGNGIAMDLYMSPDAAYDSILVSTQQLKSLVLYQEDRLRMDSLRNEVRSFQRIAERPDTVFAPGQREEFRRKLKGLLVESLASANLKLEHRKTRLEESTGLLDRWLFWMLALAGTLITIATVYSFSFLRQRRKAEGFNRTLLETTNNGIVSFDPKPDDGLVRDYVMTYCNDAASRLLGIDKHKQATLSSLIPAAILNDVRQVFDHVYRNKMSRTIEGYLDHSQERKWLHATVIPLDEGLLVSIYDFTAERRFQQKLTYKINQLKVINDELQQYAYVTSHDLQEPLRKIQMFSDMGTAIPEKKKLTPEDFFTKISKVATEMRERLQTLLMFTRSTDTFDETENVDLNQVVCDVVKELKGTYPDARVNNAQLPIVEGSATHLRLLFFHLLQNACQYSMPGTTSEITVTERKTTQYDHYKFPVLDQLMTYSCISVRDNGIGFAPEHSEKIFVLFQRLFDKPDVPGSGIGLAICRKIVNQHHGYIYAEGAENQGAVIHVFLPLQQPTEQD